MRTLPTAAWHIGPMNFSSAGAQAPLSPPRGEGLGERGPLPSGFMRSSLFHSGLLTAHEPAERRPATPLSSEERGWGELELPFRFMVISV